MRLHWRPRQMYIVSYSWDFNFATRGWNIFFSRKLLLRFNSSCFGRRKGRKMCERKFSIDELLIFLFEEDRWSASMTLFVSKFPWNLALVSLNGGRQVDPCFWSTSLKMSDRVLSSSLSISLFSDIRQR